MINPETGNRIRMKTVDAEPDQEVQRRDLVKGYEFRKDQYLLVSYTDSVKVESSSVMNIEKLSRPTQSIRSTTPPVIIWHKMATPDGMSMLCSSKPSLSGHAIVRLPWPITSRARAAFPVSGGIAKECGWLPRL